MGHLITEAPQLVGVKLEHQELSVPMGRVQILLEMDIDADLPGKWDW